jgi:hypothetical protein
MATNKAQKRVAFDSSSPLQQAGILKHMLDYVGPGHWCFVAAGGETVTSELLAGRYEMPNGASMSRVFLR